MLFILQMRQKEAEQISSAGGVFSVPSVQASISDNYSNMVKAGHIHIVQGYVHSAAGSTLTLTPQRSTESEPVAHSVLDNVDDVILCTGFTPALDFLDPSILESLGFDENDTLQPLLLHRDVMHPDTPGLYFVGMYRGPYFAGVELQAVRFTVVAITFILFVCLMH